MTWIERVPRLPLTKLSRRLQRLLRPSPGQPTTPNKKEIHLLTEGALLFLRVGGSLGGRELIVTKLVQINNDTRRN